MRRSLLALALVGALSVLHGGCVSVTEQHTETVLSRQRYELTPRRQETADAVLIDTKWERGQLVLRVVRRWGYQADVAERQTVDKKTVRTPDSWAPAIVAGVASVAAIGTMVVAEERKSACTPAGMDAGCGFGAGLVETAAAGGLILGGAALLINLAMAADQHKVETRDVTTGATTSRPAFGAASAARVTVRWADGTELSATTDAEGVARIAIPSERADAHASPADLLVDGRRIRAVDMGATIDTPQPPHAP